MVIEGSRPIAQVARELGLVENTLGSWVSAYRKKHPDEEEPLTISERARLRELERENRELQMQSEFLTKAAAYFRPESSVTDKYEFIDGTAVRPCGQIGAAKGNS